MLRTWLTFDVSVNDLILMQISHTLKDLLAIADNNPLVKGAVSLKQLCNRATFRQDTMQEKNKSSFQTVGGDNNIIMIIFIKKFMETIKYPKFILVCFSN